MNLQVFIGQEGVYLLMLFKKKLGHENGKNSFCKICVTLKKAVIITDENSIFMSTLSWQPSVDILASWACCWNTEATCNWIFLSKSPVACPPITTATGRTLKMWSMTLLHVEMVISSLQNELILDMIVW